MIHKTDNQNEVIDSTIANETTMATEAATDKAINSPADADVNDVTNQLSSAKNDNADNLQQSKVVESEEAKESNNIIYIGERDEAPKFVRLDNKAFRLPDTEIQKKGFYNKDATLIINTFPQLYKSLVKLGE